MKASLDKVVKIAEIIGSLGIVISLIFVSIQYQNNSLALQTSTANSVNANIADWYTAFFENAEASEAFMKFVSAPESVTPSERFRAIMRLHSLNLHLQNALYLEGKGVLDADTVEWFKRNGGLTRKNGDHFRRTLLSRGGSKDALKLFEDFKGSSLWS